MNWNTCNFIKRIEQVLAELDISAIEEYVIIIIYIPIYTTYVIYMVMMMHPKLFHNATLCTQFAIFLRACVLR